MSAILALLSPFVPTILSVLGTLLVGLITKYVKDQARIAFIERAFKAAVPVVYHAVDEISRKTPNKVDDKVALGLKLLNDYLAAEGVKKTEITDSHIARAKILFDSLHAQDKKAESMVIVDPGGYDDVNIASGGLKN